MTHQEIEDKIEALRKEYKGTTDVSMRKILEKRAKLLKWAMERRLEDSPWQKNMQFPS